MRTLAVFCLLTSQAVAATLYIQGNLPSAGLGYSINGSMILDSDSGEIEVMELNLYTPISGYDHITYTNTSLVFDNVLTWRDQWRAMYIELKFPPDITSLIGYRGSALWSPISSSPYERSHITAFDINHPRFNDGFIARIVGNITPVPEPSTLILACLSWLLCLMFFLRLKFRAVQITSTK